MFRRKTIKHDVKTPIIVTISRRGSRMMATSARDAVAPGSAKVIDPSTLTKCVHSSERLNSEVTTFLYSYRSIVRNYELG